MLNMSGREVRQGLASSDEMCDVYLVYSAPELLEGNMVCTNPGLKHSKSNGNRHVLLNCEDKHQQFSYPPKRYI